LAISRGAAGCAKARPAGDRRGRSLGNPQDDNARRVARAERGRAAEIPGRLRRKSRRASVCSSSARPVAGAGRSDCWASGARPPGPVAFCDVRSGLTCREFGAEQPARSTRRTHGQQPVTGETLGWAPHRVTLSWVTASVAGSARSTPLPTRIPPPASRSGRRAAPAGGRHELRRPVQEAVPMRSASPAELGGTS